MKVMQGSKLNNPYPIFPWSSISMKCKFNNVQSWFIQATSGVRIYCHRNRYFVPNFVLHSQNRDLYKQYMIVEQWNFNKFSSVKNSEAADCRVSQRTFLSHTF